MEGSAGARAELGALQVRELGSRRLLSLCSEEGAPRAASCAPAPEACWERGLRVSPSGPPSSLRELGVAEPLSSDPEGRPLRSGVEGVLSISYVGSKVKVQEQIDRTGCAGQEGSPRLCSTSSPSLARALLPPAHCPQPPGPVSPLPTSAGMAQPLPLPSLPSLPVFPTSVCTRQSRR